MTGAATNAAVATEVAMAPYLRRLRVKKGIAKLLVGCIDVIWVVGRGTFQATKEISS